ncbi:MAG: RhuM family protein [Patescibacteria group bacterium]
MKKDIIIYQSKQGEIEFRGDLEKETLWASLQQIADLFEIDKSGISRHIKNIYDTGELDIKATVAKIATVRTEGIRTVQREIEHYNLDLILSVGYRVNSKTATKFRQWATKTLRQHIIKGYTLNKKRLVKNHQEFLQAVQSLQILLPEGNKITAKDALELVKIFAGTWQSLDAYDKSTLPKVGSSKMQASLDSAELSQAIGALKQELIRKNEASELFAQEKQPDVVAGIIGNVFQSAFGRDAYETLEEKAAHLLYFFVKNHPFTDGNKRSGALAFVWFLNKVSLLRKDRISPETLTTLTLLVAESNPKDKEKVIGLILQLLGK